MSNLLFHITLTNLRKVPQWFNGSFLYQFFTQKRITFTTKTVRFLENKTLQKEPISTNESI